MKCLLQPILSVIFLLLQFGTSAPVSPATGSKETDNKEEAEANPRRNLQFGYYQTRNVAPYYAPYQRQSEINNLFPSRRWSQPRPRQRPWSQPRPRQRPPYYRPTNNDDDYGEDYDYDYDYDYDSEEDSNDSSSPEANDSGGNLVQEALRREIVRQEALEQEALEQEELRQEVLGQGPLGLEEFSGGADIAASGSSPEQEVVNNAPPSWGLKLPPNANAPTEPTTLTTAAALVSGESGAGTMLSATATVLAITLGLMASTSIRFF